MLCIFDPRHQILHDITETRLRARTQRDLQLQVRRRLAVQSNALMSSASDAVQPGTLVPSTVNPPRVCRKCYSRTTKISTVQMGIPQSLQELVNRKIRAKEVKYFFDSKRSPTKGITEGGEVIEFSHNHFRSALLDLIMYHLQSSVVDEDTCGIETLAEATLTKARPETEKEAKERRARKHKKRKLPADEKEGESGDEKEDEPEPELHFRKRYEPVKVYTQPYTDEM